MIAEKLVLVTGATGYVGGCLVPRLLEKGLRVRVLVRDPVSLAGHAWLPDVELARGDLLSPEPLNLAMHRVSAAYYLVHNMASGRNYVDKENISALNFKAAAESAGVEHVIYLGGLVNPLDDIGQHMRSRLKTGDILRQGRVPVTEFRASLIIGSGSISFELIRYLTEQFPILLGPRWMKNLTQPIAIQQVLEYLLLALDTPACRGQIYEIGGKDVLPYAQVTALYAKLRGLKRWIFILPGLPIRLMALLAGVLTPVPASVAGALFGGMRSDSVVRTDLAERDFPGVHVSSYAEAVSQALAHLSPVFLVLPWENKPSSFRIRQAGFFIEGRRILLHIQPDTAFRVVTALGGENGWFYWNGLWKLRGFLDKLLGGPGLRGRKAQDILSVGDVIDFYRVEALEKDRLIRLFSDLKAPGLGWMEWRIKVRPEGGTLLEQKAYFAPKGATGFLYWYLLLPIHRLVFKGLLRAIARRTGGLQDPGRISMPKRRTL